MKRSAVHILTVLALASAAAAQEKRAVLSVIRDTGVMSARGKHRYSNGAGPSAFITSRQAANQKP